MSRAFKILLELVGNVSYSAISACIWCVQSQVFHSGQQVFLSFCVLCWMLRLRKMGSDGKSFSIKAKEILEAHTFQPEGP